MSDSLSATVIVISLELINSANPELELDELELEPSVAAATAPAKPPDDEELDELDDELLELEPVEPLLEIVCPGAALESDTIVPLAGA
jgi:hypothetical protein